MGAREEIERERESDLPSRASLPQWLQCVFKKYV